MADRRPWPSARPPESTVAVMVTRARALGAVKSPEVRYFLMGMRAAQTAAEDIAEEVYNAADRLEGPDRAEGFARAAGAKLAAHRIGRLFDVAAGEDANPPAKRSVRLVLRHILSRMMAVGGA